MKEQGPVVAFTDPQQGYMPRVSLADDPGTSEEETHPWQKLISQLSFFDLHGKATCCFMQMWHDLAPNCTQGDISEHA